MRLLIIALVALMSFVTAASANDFKISTSTNLIIFHNRLRHVHITLDDIIPEISVQSTRTRNDMLCLAMNIFHEGRGSTQADRWAIGFVTRNRVKSGLYPHTYCRTVWETRYAKSDVSKVSPYAQFSWTAMSGRTEMKANPVWLEAQRIALLIHRDADLHDTTDGATLFWNHTQVTPPWASKTCDRVRIQQHTFAKFCSEKYLPTS